MYYDIDSSRVMLGLKKRPCARVRSLKNICLRFIVANKVRFNEQILPIELCEDIIKRSFRTIQPKLSAGTDFPYIGDLVGLHNNRISPIIYDKHKLVYMNLVSVRPLIVRILTPAEDNFLNLLLLDYVSQSMLIYSNLRTNPYID